MKQQANDCAEVILETLRTPLVVVNAEMRIRTANRAFCDIFKIRPDEAEGALLSNIGEGSWMPPALNDFFKQRPTNETRPGDFMFNHDFAEMGKRTIIIHAQGLPTPYGSETLMLLSFEDITGYKKAERSLVETQEQLKLAMDAGSVDTWSWDLRTDEVSIMGERQYKLYGLPGMTMATYVDWEKMIHPDDRTGVRSALKNSIENRVPLDTEFRIITPDGTPRWILAKGIAYYDERGTPQKIVGVNIDVTERRNAIQSLEESEKRFHTMSDNAPVMIWMADVNQKVIFLNKTWLSFTGRSLEEESGEGWLECIHPEDRKLFVEVYDHAHDTRQKFKIEYRLKRHDGVFRWFLALGIPRFAGAEDFKGFIGTCIDITDRIDLEHQKDEFMSIASHELKTPVTSIKAYAQILLERFRLENDMPSSNLMTRLDVQIDKLTGLINTLLDVAKVQSGKMDYLAESFDINEFVLEVTEEMQPSCPKHHLVTELRAEGTIFGDKARLSQVLNNLIANAVKYSPKASEVIIKVERHDEDYVMSVQDFGVGIPKEMQQKVFDRFFRVTDVLGNRVSGLGLGLFISSEIVKQHGGKLWLQSAPGAGSTFFFSLPARRS